VLKLLLLIPLLLAAAAAANWSSIQEITSGKRTLKSVVYGRMDKDASALANMKMPADIGSKDAKVTVEVFLSQGDPCHIDTMFAGQSLGQLDPKRIRVKFVNMHDPKIAERVNKLKLGCMQAVAVNGKTKFTVPGPRVTKAAAVLGGHATPAPDAAGGGNSPPGPSGLAAGTPGGKNAQGAQATPAARKDHVVYLTAQEHWAHSDLHWILDTELKKAYKGKGLGITAKQFETKMVEGAKSARGKAEAEAEAIAAGPQGEQRQQGAPGK
jgi:hypothetical protein